MVRVSDIKCKLYLTKRAELFLIGFGWISYIIQVRNLLFGMRRSVRLVVFSLQDMAQKVICILATLYLNLDEQSIRIPQKRCFIR